MKYIIYLLLLAIGMSCKPTHDFNHFRTKKLDPECEVFWTGFTKYLKKDKDGFLNLEQIPKDSISFFDFMTYLSQPLREQKERGYSCCGKLTRRDIIKMLGEPHAVSTGRILHLSYIIRWRDEGKSCPASDFKWSKKNRKKTLTGVNNPYKFCANLTIRIQDGHVSQMKLSWTHLKYEN